MPFAGIRHSANSHRTVFHRILARQGCINTRALARWTHSIFRASGVSYTGFLPSAVLDRMAYALRKLLDIQPTVTVQCFTAF